NNNNNNKEKKNWILNNRGLKKNTEKLYRRFFALTAVTTIPIVIINILEQTVFYSYVNAPYQHISQKGKSIVHVMDAILTSFRLLFSVNSFVFLCVFFQFIVECHRGDLLRHVRMYDTLWTYVDDASEKNDPSLKKSQKRKNTTTSKSRDVKDFEHEHEHEHEQKHEQEHGQGHEHEDRYDEVKAERDYLINVFHRYQRVEDYLAKIVADWDRITSSVRKTSKNFRWWIVAMVVLNFIA
ncbi:ubiquitin transferase, partial [Reticulomyxa filosa]